MRKRLLVVLAVVALVFPVASSQLPLARTRCCRGCGSYGCSHHNCGDTCGKGPNCHGCRTIVRTWG
jgi:hypothetical protein